MLINHNSHLIGLWNDLFLYNFMFYGSVYF